MSDKGTLTFRTHFHSLELAALELPVEIRTSDLRLVTRTLTSKSVQVEPGEYHVSSRLPAGQELQAHVQVSPGQSREVVLEPDTCDGSPKESLEVQHFLRYSVTTNRNKTREPATTRTSQTSKRSRSRLRPFGRVAAQVLPPAGLETAQLTNAFDDDGEVAEPAGVVAVKCFEGNPLLDVRLVFTQEFPATLEPQAIALPPNAAAGQPLVYQVCEAHKLPLNTMIPLGPDGPPPELTLLPPESESLPRRIGIRLRHPAADLLSRYVRRGLLFEASETLGSDSMDGERLLNDKQRDPVAAAVGAYAILRAGDMGSLHEWTKNLMEWFPWLPDGAAIRGEHLARKGKHAEALAAFLLLQSRGLPFISEGLSYAVDRLRLYTGKATAPPGASAEEIGAAKGLLARLKPFASHLNFERSFVTFTGLDPEAPDNKPFVPESELVRPPGADRMGKTTMNANSEFVFNGINGATGEYLESPKSAKQIAAMVLSDPAFPANLRSDEPRARHLRELKYRLGMGTVESYGTRFGVPPDRVERAGWAVIFPQGIERPIIDALRPLLDLRKEQAGPYYKEFVDAAGYAREDTKDDFLRRQGMGPGPADPERVPYYLLIVGDPETIPYQFQYQLDVQYAVGRIWFDTVEEYERYAHSVVMSETGKLALARRAVLFGAANPNDRATELSSQQLVAPLAQRAAAKGAGGQWSVDAILAGDATHKRLSEVIGGKDTPALLFTATHGIGFPLGDSRQAAYQGALLCQDWPGPGGSLKRDHYFAAEDVTDSARVAGLVAFHFACYGAGTPQLDDFAHQSFRKPTAIAPRPFVAALPRRLLGHPLGGALAVVGHVERAWGCSIVWPDAGPQIQAFEDAIEVLMQGLPVGYAIESINQRYADISSALSLELLDIRDGKKVADEYALASQWTANNDARSYVVIGDPAVRIPLAPAGSPGVARASMAPIILSPRLEAPAAPPQPPPAMTTESKPSGSSSEIVSDGEQLPERPLGPQIESTGQSANLSITLPLKLTVSVSLGGGTAGLEAGGAQVEQTGDASQVQLMPSGPAPFAVEIDPDYDAREGYDPDFLGTGARRVPLPQLSPQQRADAAVVSGADGPDRHELKYHHYSVVLNGKRRLAFFTAVNINGRLASSPAREPDKWFFDPRVARSQQVGEDLYASNDLDRGHLVRRLDPAWGRTAAIVKRANDDTFHFTNCSPQHKRFNQGKNLWAGLEDYLLNKAADESRRMTVFTGPIFTSADPKYRGVRVPKRYWKIAVIVRPNGRVASLGFIVDQTALLKDMISFGPADVAKTFQTPVSQIEQLTGLKFGRLAELDAGSIVSFAAGEPQQRELSSFEDIVLPAATPAPAAPAFEVSSGSLPPPPEVVEGTDIRYYLVAFDEAGRERRDHPAGHISRLVQEAVAEPSVTDVILMSHGWQGDVPAARAQYRNWIRAMAQSTADRDRLKQVRPGFKPVIVGIHWPSQPWGDEQLGPASFAITEASAGSGPLGEASLAAAIEAYADRLGDTPEARERIRDPLRAVLALSTSVSASEPAAMPPELREAYRQLDAGIGLAAKGLDGDPSSDREPFDPDGVYQAARLQASPPGAPVAFGGGSSRDSLLAPLRTLSFWKMKDRARKMGEGAVHELLLSLQQSIGNRSVRFHLVGHSFGCIVVSGAVAGPGASATLPQPVDTLVLLQGAVSLWSYCGDIPHAPGTPGYYHRLLTEGRVRGPIVTTRSSFDRAVGTWYPLAARASRAVAFAPDALPKYGGIGSFGIQGADLEPADLTIRDVASPYALTAGAVTNVEASSVVRVGGGMSGAHSDICKPEVAHLIWSAMVPG